MTDPSAPASDSALRHDMVQSAVSFLADPKVQSSPVSQRISFLESKGLTPQEIDAALSQAPRGAGVHPAAAYPMVPAYPPWQRPQRDWRDWFIMAVVSGTVGYGVIALARKYLYPHLQPPNQTQVEADLAALDAKYDEVAAHLDEIDETTNAIARGLEEHQAEVAKSVADVNELIKSVREREEAHEAELRETKRVVDEIREDVSTQFQRSRDAQSRSLSELQTELKSLRSLLVSRGAAPASAPAPAAPPAESAPPPPRPAPSIPAWQLADN
ncbi:peroxisomal membrane protein pex14 [Malassezia cuniculi]|uniref:Peroxisomal membrane protein PEX14 n=1 Tax=Malassezia cuniculi TaxID=948313 RepID=A0AAF0JDG8_9BASI|nr:peroxisomal membrane protein pex14 [Malassezia cuniculi]